MSHWISVYCQKRVAGFSAARLKTAIERGCTDYRGYNYFKDLFALVKVTKVSADKQAGSSLFHVSYQVKDAKQGAGGVPITLDRIVDPETVKGMVREQLEEYLQGRRGPKAALVRDHLAKVVEVYSFGLKASHRGGAGDIIADAARTFLAREGRGMVRETGVGWLKWTPFGLFEALRE